MGGVNHIHGTYHIRALLAAFALAVAGVSCSQPLPTRAVEQGPQKFNLVLIVADTLRADRVTMQRNGKPLMPNLAGLATQSWDYRLCRTQATWTKPSMASLFTSLYPEVHQVLYGIDGGLNQEKLPETDILPPVLETMAEFMKANGYTTAGIQTNANIVAHFGFDQGFDSYESIQYPKLHGDTVTHRALERLRTMSGPFFLYVHYMDMHAPYRTPDTYRDPDVALPEITGEDQELIAHYNEGYRDRVMFEVGITTKRNYPDLSPAGEKYVRAEYDSSAHFLDEQLGQLVRQITVTHPNTVIVITADHGEELWEHGSIGHGKTVYEELTRVPLIVCMPGARPRSVNAPVETIDILPTCAALLGLPRHPSWQGIDIAAEPGHLAADRPVFSAATMSMKSSNRNLETVIIGAQKLLVDKVARTQTIYDLDNDPGEQHGAELTSAPSADGLARALEQFHAANLRHPLRQNSATTRGLTPEQEENIRNIGYLK